MNLKSTFRESDSHGQVQYFFAFKSIIAPIIFLAVFGDTLRRAGGTIPDIQVVGANGPHVGGAVLAWAFFGSEYPDLTIQ